jgi:hypothetical protein
MKRKHMLDVFVLSLHGPRLMRRFETLRLAGKKYEALETGRECLEVLRKAKAGPAVVCMIVVVDQLAADLKMQGVSEADLRGALHALQRLPAQEAKPDVARTIADYISFLEKRLGNPGDEEK